MTHPHPTFALAPAGADGDGPSALWVEWEARMEATADARRLDPALVARVLANEAAVRRVRLAMEAL